MQASSPRCGASSREPCSQYGTQPRFHSRQDEEGRPTFDADRITSHTRPRPEIDHRIGLIERMQFDPTTAPARTDVDKLCDGRSHTILSPEERELPHGSLSIGPAVTAATRDDDHLQSRAASHLMQVRDELRDPMFGQCSRRPGDGAPG